MADACRAQSFPEKPRPQLPQRHGIHSGGAVVRCDDRAKMSKDLAGRVYVLKGPTMPLQDDRIVRELLANGVQ